MTYTSTCRYCGEKHGMICPWVKAIEFYPTDDNVKGGAVKRIEFWSRAELDAMTKAGHPVVRADPPPLSTGTGVLKGTAVGTLFNTDQHNADGSLRTGAANNDGASIIMCARCGKEGHFALTCPDTMAELRRWPL
jgi:hypothetical protein